MRGGPPGARVRWTIFSQMRTYLDFEKPIAELESKVAELRTLAAQQNSVSISEELGTETVAA